MAAPSSVRSSYSRWISTGADLTQQTSPARRSPRKQPPSVVGLPPTKLPSRHPRGPVSSHRPLSQLPTLLLNPRRHLPLQQQLLQHLRVSLQKPHNPFHHQQERRKSCPLSHPRIISRHLDEQSRNLQRPVQVMATLCSKPPAVVIPPPQELRVWPHHR